VIQLWGRVNSINVMKVLWALDELNVPYTRSDAGMEFGVVDRPHYLQMNPNGKVPVINDEGFMLWESNAIVRYVSYKYGLGTMYPTDVRRRAEAEQWMEWQQTTVSPPMAYPFHGLVRMHAAYQDEGTIARAAAELSRLWAMLDAHLEERDYILGDSFTMADIPLGAAAWRWLNLPIKRYETPHVTRWHERLKSRNSFKRHVMHELS
jgi:glutathione S-transferase